MKPINPKRKKFCRLVAGGETGAGAYRKAYKNPNNDTCKKNAHRLLQQPGVIIFLAIMQDAKQQAGPATNNNASAPKAASQRKPEATDLKKQKKKVTRKANRLYETMDEAECRVLLSRIARGQTTIPKYMAVDGKVFELPIPPNCYQRLYCIKELNKMSGSYA